MADENGRRAIHAQSVMVAGGHLSKALKVSSLSVILGTQESHQCQNLKAKCSDLQGPLSFF